MAQSATTAVSTSHKALRVGSWPCLAEGVQLFSNEIVFPVSTSSLWSWTGHLEGPGLGPQGRTLRRESGGDTNEEKRVLCYTSPEQGVQRYASLLGPVREGASHIPAECSSRLLGAGCL